MSRTDDIDYVDPEDVTLTEAMLGYDILVDGVHTGSIEGLPGQLDHIEVHPYWEDKGVARAALDTFIELSREHGISKLTTNDAVHPAIEHILASEGFDERQEDIGWVKEL